MWPPFPAVRAAPALSFSVLLGLALLAGWRFWQHEDTALPPDIEVAERQRLVAQVRTPRADDAALRALARTHESHGRQAEAVLVYEQLAQRHPDDVGVLLDLAVAMAMARPQGLRGSPEQLLRRVLQLDPGNLQALALLGDAAFDDHDYPQAAARWRELLDRLPPDSPMAQDIRDKFQQALALDQTRRTPRP